SVLGLLAADPHPEQLGLAQLSAALLAVDCEGRRERRLAGRAAAEDPAAAGAAVGHVVLGLHEPAPGRAAFDAEGRPVPQDVAPLLAEPVGRLAHRTTVAARRRQVVVTIPAAFPVSRPRGVQWRSRALPSRAARSKT